MRTKIKATLGIVLLLACTIAFTACGNKSWGCDAFKNEFYYVLIEETDGTVCMHEIESWHDSNSESATFTTKCCNNYIWTSANRATFYKNKPTHISNDSYRICGQEDL